MLLANRLHYLYEDSDRSEKRRFVYFCSECDCILDVRAELEPVNNTIEALENHCPGCRSSLESSISCRSTCIPEAWSGITRSAYSTRKARSVEVESAFKPAVSLRGFSFNFKPLDTLVGCMDPAWLVVLTGSCANMVSEFLCFRAQLPGAAGGLDSSVVLIDGGNRSDLYLFSSYAKLYGVAPKKALRRIVTSRAFTIYQLANLVTNELPKVVDEYGAKMVMISDILGMLDESGLREEEAKRMVDVVWSGIQEVRRKKEVRAFATLVAKTPHDQMITGRADILVNLEEVNSCIKGALLKHPFKESRSTQFRLRDLFRPSLQKEPVRIWEEQSPRLG